MSTSNGTQDVVSHIADLHFWKVAVNPLRLLNKRFLGNLNVWLRRRHEFLMEHAEAFAAAVAGTGVRQLLLTGDFTSTALAEEFFLAAAFVRGLREHGMQVHLMPGNHDAYTFEACRARRFERYFQEFLPPTGYPARVTLHGGTPLLLIPTAAPNLLTARGRVSGPTLAAVRGLLDGCPDGPVLAAAHYPLLHRTSGYACTRQHRLRHAAALRELLGRSGRRILYVAGHVHRFSFVRDDLFPNLTHLTTSAFFLRRPDAEQDGEFTEIHAGAGGFTVFRHRHGADWIRELVSCDAGIRTPHPSCENR
jgi:hypothetical protein